MEKTSENENLAEKAPERAAAKTAPRFFAAVQDIFFGTKITAAAARVGASVHFIRDPAKLWNALHAPDARHLPQDSLPHDPLNVAPAPPAVLMIDLNDASIRPVELIAKLKSSPSAAAIQIIAFVSHVQGDLIREAQKAGADLVLPRSVFSQQLDDLLRQRSCHL
jgi:CheY-like chemotaxis protein